eukprot:TRINITY_DN5746_c0_g1_i1.p1 TRINITY_DN5746_c0_g1~~TRINITY_DN5746_c0_g1_i1.p1  ORF type:complete len:1160 (+),score=210.14 TRINITY_DN5746_c0_g1_i1:85-3564(+)
MPGAGSEQGHPRVQTAPTTDLGTPQDSKISVAVPREFKSQSPRSVRFRPAPIKSPASPQQPVHSGRSDTPMDTPLLAVGQQWSTVMSPTQPPSVVRESMSAGTQELTDNSTHHLGDRSPDMDTVEGARRDRPHFGGVQPSPSDSANARLWTSTASSSTAPVWTTVIAKFRQLLRDALASGDSMSPEVRRTLIDVIDEHIGLPGRLATGSAQLQTPVTPSSSKPEWQTAVHPDEQLVVVYGYAGNWGELTSFWPCSFVFEGLTYPSLEHCYQSQKFADPEHREEIRTARTCDEAHRSGKAFRPGRTLRADWDEIRDDVMRGAMMAKFVQNPKCTATLLSTGKRTIVFADKDDNHWGIGMGTGANRYGALLMELRDMYLRTEAATHAVVVSVLGIATCWVAIKRLAPPVQRIGGQADAKVQEELQRRRRKAVDRKRNRVAWKRGELLGKGAFGTVHMGFNEVTGEMMAVKQVAFGNDTRAVRRRRRLLKEIQMMKDLEHPNIVRYYFTHCEDSSSGTLVNIFMEYVSGGSVLQVLKRFGALSPRVCSVYLEQILYGLHYLHEKGIVHRDIKGANILLCPDGSVKLADFGTSVYLEHDGQVSSYCGTPAWMAPEVIRESGHDKRADIWSVGCTVLEMLTGQVPWYHLGLRGFALQQWIGFSTDPVTLPPEVTGDSYAAGFALRCLQRDQRCRPDAQSLYRDPFLVHWSDQLQDTDLHDTRRQSTCTQILADCSASTPRAVLPPAPPEHYQQQQLQQSGSQQGSPPQPVRATPRNAARGSEVRFAVVRRSSHSQHGTQQVTQAQAAATLSEDAAIDSVSSPGKSPSDAGKGLGKDKESSTPSPGKSLAPRPPTAPQSPPQINTPSSDAEENAWSAGSTPGRGGLLRVTQDVRAAQRHHFEHARISIHIAMCEAAAIQKMRSLVPREAVDQVLARTAFQSQQHIAQRYFARWFALVARKREATSRPIQPLNSVRRRSSFHSSVAEAAAASAGGSRQPLSAGPRPPGPASRSQPRWELVGSTSVPPPGGSPAGVPGRSPSGGGKSAGGSTRLRFRLVKSPSQSQSSRHGPRAESCSPTSGSQSGRWTQSERIASPSGADVSPCSTALNSDAASSLPHFSIPHVEDQRGEADVGAASGSCDRRDTDGFPETFVPVPVKTTTSYSAT